MAIVEKFNCTLNFYITPPFTNKDMLSKSAQSQITHIKVLKSKNVKNTNGGEAVVGLDPLVDLVD